MNSNVRNLETMQSRFRLGIDAGGTFTDFVLADRTGAIQLFKTPSTPEDPTIAIANGLELIHRATGLSAAEIVANSDLCINGTTVALNALIEHKGVRTGLICTAGHEDSLEIRLGHKEDGHRYDLAYPPAVMLVPRNLRRGVKERVLSDGSVRTELDEDDVRAACALFRAEGVQAVAISFLWSVLNPAHERRAAEIVREMLPGVFVTVGSEIYPQVREYTRTSTAALNAYLSPILARYVAKVDAYFQGLGAARPLRYFQSNGGLATGQVMRDRAVCAINSGPASAPQAGQVVAAPFGVTNVITVDMGGTSFDITLTTAGVTNVDKNIDFLRYRIGVPMIQVATLGAGGGSIAWIDHMGLLQVGPESAGATPGPACYSRGGRRPTVTDANLVLGYLSPDGLLRGAMKLDVAAAREAIATIAEPLGLTIERAAYGIYQVVNNSMVNGIRRVSIERGYDPRDYVLVGAGGATAAHITALARAMGNSMIILPKLASGLCAFGQIVSDAKYNFMATCPGRLSSPAIYSTIRDQFHRIESEGRKSLMADGFTDDRIEIRRTADLRYVGQIHECTVDLPMSEISEATGEAIKAAFHRRHEELYAYCEVDTEVEIVNIESTLFGRIERPAVAPIELHGLLPKALKGSRSAIFSADGRSVEAMVYDGSLIGCGVDIVGPAIIEEETTTIVIEPGWKANLHPSGSYVIEAVTACS